MSNSRIRKHMAAVESYRQRLAALQGSWDTLSLLSHLSANGTDITHTRQAFESLSGDLLSNLEVETLNRTVLALKASAQMSIDIIVRNLFERTADVGFLCADGELGKFVAAAKSSDPDDHNFARHRQRIQVRLREYVAKYSVYHNVIVTDLDGKVLVQLDDHNNVAQSRDPLLRQTINSSGYVETFRHSDLSPAEQQSLIYSQRICADNRPIGILCLCFKFSDEVAGIFAKLRDAAGWTVFTFVDANRRVIASNDHWQMPLGVQLEAAHAEDGAIIRACGREYLAITRKTNGYQGYMGPGWCAQALIPLEQAFDHDDSSGFKIAEDVFASLRSSKVIFSPALRSIPVKAEGIQRELNRSVWNGNVCLTEQGGSKDDFAKVLLWEIGNTGVKTKEAFELSIGELQQTVVSAILQEARSLASLAVDILDRNLYERANDCRWWALDTTLIDELGSDQPNSEKIGEVLRYINGLYTVYDSIVVFDAQRRIVAVSNNNLRSVRGKQLNEEWAERTLQLRNSQHYCVSSFVPSPLYGDQHTLIYSAAVPGKGGRPVGGVAVVFDSTPQIVAMLRDSLPRSDSGEMSAGGIGVLVDANNRVIAATDRFSVGEPFAAAKLFTGLVDGGSAQILSFDGQHYAVGACKTPGYREYPGLDATAYLLLPLGAVAATQIARRRTQTGQRRSASTDEQMVDIASFHCHDQWLGIYREQVVESIDGANLRPMPGRPVWYAGCLMYRGEPLPVIDLGRLTGRSTAAKSTEVVVVRARNQQHIGLLVDELADIPEVPASSIRPVADVMLHGNSSVVDQTVRPQNDTDQMLLILNIDKLLTQFRTNEPLAIKAG